MDQSPPDLAPDGAGGHPAAAPLRDAVLAGRYFGTAHAAAAEALARFTSIAGAADAAAWFGPDRAARLLADADALRGALDRDIAAIDGLIGAQLDAILHHSRMRRLEGSWRGLAWLLEGIDTSAKIKVKVQNTTWGETCRDLERAPDFDQSHLFRRIYEDEFGTPGGEPFGLLIIDHELRYRPAPGAPTDDVGTLKLLAGVAAAAFVPTVLGASPALLGVDGFSELAMATDPAAPLRGPEAQRWRGLSALEDIRFIAVALPRMLARPPWRDDPARRDGFRYREYAPDLDSRVWSAAGYAFAAAVVRAFAAFAWPADVRGVETDRRGGGLVDHMPLEPFATDPGTVWTRPSLEIVLTDSQERLLIEAGLMPLTAIPYTTDAVFAAVRSLQAPAQYTSQAATANARLSAQINSMLCVSRFAHVLKMMGRDMVGAFLTADEIERRLHKWLLTYANSNVSATGDIRARYPLVNASVSVQERPGRPGVFGCVIQLQPHFQLDDVSAQFRLVTEIAAPGVARG
jgi:type VI secretion system protein ImpD/type VI secretion system protein ImpC